MSLIDLSWKIFEQSRLFVYAFLFPIILYLVCVCCTCPIMSLAGGGGGGGGGGGVHMRSKTGSMRRRSPLFIDQPCPLFLC